jgi:hypothetical protein
VSTAAIPQAAFSSNTAYQSQSPAFPIQQQPVWPVTLQQPVLNTFALSKSIGALPADALDRKLKEGASQKKVDEYRARLALRLERVVPATPEEPDPQESPREPSPCKRAHDGQFDDSDEVSYGSPGTVSLDSESGPDADSDHDRRTAAKRRKRQKRLRYFMQVKLKKARAEAQGSIKLTKEKEELMKVKEEEDQPKAEASSSSHAPASSTIHRARERLQPVGCAPAIDRRDGNPYRINPYGPNFHISYFLLRPVRVAELGQIVVLRVKNM